MCRDRFTFAIWSTLFSALLLVLIGTPRRANAHADLILQIEGLTKQIEQEPRNIELYMRRGELHRAHVDWESSLADFNRVLAIDPNFNGVDFAKGRLMADSNWPLSAKAYLDRFLASNPNHAEAFTARARVHTRLSLHLAAADDYAAAIKLSPEPGPELFIERSQTLASQSPEYYARALEALDDGVKRIGPLVTLQLFAVDLELKQKNYNGALERIDKIAERSPRKETWFARRGEILEQAQRPQEAREAYQAALTALATLPPVRRNVPAMAELEKRIRAQLVAINAASPPQ